VGTDVDVPVLIVGGGPVGLSTAIALRRFGVDCVLVERHASTLDFPKGRRVTVRTMEIFRQWGLEEAVEAAALPREESLAIYWGETLLASDFRRASAPSVTETTNSPTQEVICSQELLEPVLRGQAQSLGADVRFGVAQTSLVQDQDNVTAELVDPKTGERTQIRASYLVAADGARSPCRAELGAGWVSIAELGDMVSILVKADLAARVADRPSALYRIDRPREGSLFAVVDNVDHWLLMTPYDPELEPPESFTDKRCLELVGAGIGDRDVALSLVGHRFWRAAAGVAERFRKGRVFLVGDAAHVTTPVGGLGMNCGISDVHNLAWKLAGVIAGWATPALLDSYEPERQPVARACAEASLGPARPPNPVEGLVLGYAYESPVIVPDDTPLPVPEDPLGDYVPTGRPGHRAPHLWLERDGTRRSVIDLFDDSFVALSNTPKPLDAFDRGSDRSNVPLRVQAVNEPGFLDLYGLDETGVVLVRPDGHVAWRWNGDLTDAGDRLAAALRVAAGHPGRPT
jgi:putative polyketide hydroxylase